MKSFLPIMIRLFLLGGVAAASYVYIAKPQNLPTPIQQVLNSSVYKFGDLVSTFDKNHLLTKAGEKLTQPQPIVQEDLGAPSSQETQLAQVKGASTTQIQETAQNALNTAVNQVTTQLQSLPKKEAAKLLRQSCEQIATNLEN